MPELPEVETVCRGLRAQILGRRIEGVEVRNAAVIHQNLAPEEFAARLRGRSICGVERRGKYILIVLDQGWLVCHLRMTGKLLVRAQEAAPELHTHVVFALDGGLALHYNDVRRFGGFTWSDSDPRALAPLSALGPEPLEEDFDAAYLYASARGRKRPVKSHILDQGVVAGIGNIYADEILFRAGVRPKKSAARLTKADCDALVRATKEILAEAICAGGSTIRDYVDSSMRAGSFQLAHQVYGRAGKPCYSCGSILKSVTVGGRSSVYCPHCQKS